ncbi:hypothetical protein JL721_3840 [Aureococcus anophagefferens]|nr:hypothetical protein JL721_3840 [Aureococcus anophagefferens]
MSVRPPNWRPPPPPPRQRPKTQKSRSKQNIVTETWAEASAAVETVEPPPVDAPDTDEARAALLGDAETRESGGSGEATEAAATPAAGAAIFEAAPVVAEAVADALEPILEEAAAEPVFAEAAAEPAAEEATVTSEPVVTEAPEPVVEESPVVIAPPPEPVVVAAPPAILEDARVSEDEAPPPPPPPPLQTSTPPTQRRAKLRRGSCPAFLESSRSMDEGEAVAPFGEERERTTAAILIQSEGRRRLAARARRRDVRARATEVLAATLRVQCASRRVTSLQRRRRLEEHRRKRRSSPRAPSGARWPGAARWRRPRTATTSPRARPSPSTRRTWRPRSSPRRRALAALAQQQRRRGRLSALLRRVVPGGRPAPEPAIPTAEVAIPEAPLFADVARVESFRFDRDGSISAFPIALAVPVAGGPAPAPRPSAPRPSAPPVPSAPPPPPLTPADRDEEATPPRQRAPPPAPPPPAPGRPSTRAAAAPRYWRRTRAPPPRRGAVALLGDSAPPRASRTTPRASAPCSRSCGRSTTRTCPSAEAVRCAALLGSLDLAHFAMDDEAPPVRRRVLAALAEDGAFETGVLRDDATALRRRFSLAVSPMKALEDVSLEEGVLLGVAAKLRGTLLALPARRPALLAAPLEKGMQAQRSERVREALVAIAGELRAVDSLRRIAIFDSSTAVRRRAVDALGANGALSELRELVFSGDDDAGIRGEALHWMARLDDLDGICRRGFNDRNAELRASAARLLGDVAPRGPAEEHRCVGPPKRPWRPTATLNRGAALECLGELGDPAEALDRVATRDGDVDNRLRAVAWLGTLGRAKTLRCVCLVDGGPAVRSLAAATLGEVFRRQNFAGPEVAALKAALAVRLGDAERAVRKAAAAALDSVSRERRWRDVVQGDAGDCGRLLLVPGPKATAVLVSVLCDARDLEDRGRAADALGDRDDCPKLVVDALCASAGAVAALPAALRLAALRALRKQAGKYDGASVGSSTRPSSATWPGPSPRLRGKPGTLAGGPADAADCRAYERVVRAAAARALGALQEDDLAVDALHDALRLDREPLVKRAACAALGCLRHPRSLKPLLAPLRDKKDATLAEAARAALEGLDYAKLPAIKRDERVLLHGPIFKRKQKLWTQLKALVLTDAPRLFYVDADSLKCKDCDLRTLEVDAPESKRAATKDLAIVVPGQGRVRVSLLFGLARDWTRAAGDALAALATPPSPHVAVTPPPASYRAPSRRLDAPDDDGDGDDAAAPLVAARAAAAAAAGPAAGRRPRAHDRHPSSSPEPPSSTGAPPIRDVVPMRRGWN